VLDPTSAVVAAKQTVQVPSATLVVAVRGSCNETLHNELVQSVTQQVIADAPPDVKDNIVVEKGNCTDVSRRLLDV
jgi:hypothetical protein